MLDKPAWVVDVILGLVSAVGKLLNAKTDEEHEAALMEASETVKAAADRRKFG